MIDNRYYYKSGDKVKVKISTRRSLIKGILLCTWYKEDGILRWVLETLDTHVQLLILPEEIKGKIKG